MKIFFCWTAFTLFFYVMQSSLLPFLSYRGITTDLMLLVVTSFSFLRGGRYGVMMGFFAGLLQDLATGTFFGVNIFIKMLTGCFIGAFSRNVFKDSFFLPLSNAAVSTAAGFSVWIAFILMLGYRPDILKSLYQTLVPMMIYNVAFALPVHYCVSRMCSLTDTVKGTRNG